MKNPSLQKRGILVVFVVRFRLIDTEPSFITDQQHRKTHEIAEPIILSYLFRNIHAYIVSLRHIYDLMVQLG